jgi:dienelactone hydrolase
MKVLTAGLSLFFFTCPLSAQEWPLLTPLQSREPLPGTALLETEEDLSRLLVDANDRFLDAQIQLAGANRSRFWKRDFSDTEVYLNSISPNREHLGSILGLTRDALASAAPLTIGKALPLNGSEYGITMHEVSWPAFSGVKGYGWLLSPATDPIADILCLPDAEGPPDQDLFSRALRLAQTGCRVLIPELIDRTENQYKMSHREWVQRPAFLLGRTLIGYEILRLQAAINCLHQETGEKKRPLGVLGKGEGGLLSLYLSALDTRVDATLVQGYFGPREKLWEEPAERNLFGLLLEFGDAEIASLIAPRAIIIEPGGYPAYGFRTPPGGPITKEYQRATQNGKPGFVPQPDAGAVTAEFARLREMTKSLDSASATLAGPGSDAFPIFAAALGIESVPESGSPVKFPAPEAPSPALAELVRHNQEVLAGSAAVRKEYFNDLKTDTLANFEQSIESYREDFRTDVIGDFELPLLPFQAKSRPYQEGEKTISYEVQLDVVESGGEKIIAYGVLTLPKDLDLQSGEKRPVVVCQHGLEGVPQDLLGEEGYKSYKAFATRLAERGFITFAPQNGYKYFDHFRLQQFKAQSIGKTLFSLIIPQHQQITAWLASQPWVDADRIAFYGLSYGGKSAMRIPPLVDQYCLSICSGDFNEWVWKNAATDEPSLRYSYANKGEYEIFEWNLGNTFNYAEMAALICPRPFMVERGHFDGVAPDEQVAFEFAKVRNLYAARLLLPEKCEIEWFPGPHTINGEGTFSFLHRHLEWPEP